MQGSLCMFLLSRGFKNHKAKIKKLSLMKKVNYLYKINMLNA